MAQSRQCVGISGLRSSWMGGWVKQVVATIQRQNEIAMAIPSTSGSFVIAARNDTQARAFCQRRIVVTLRLRVSKEMFSAPETKIAHSASMPARIAKPAQLARRGRKLLFTDVDNCCLLAITIRYALPRTGYPQRKNFTAQIFLIQHDFFLDNKRKKRL